MRHSDVNLCGKTLGAALLLSAAATPAAGAARPVLHVRPLVVAPGGRVHVSGNADGCSRGDAVLVLSRPFPDPGFAGVGAIAARVAGGGSFSAFGRIRTHVRAGRYGVTARCGGGNLGVAVFIRVR
jgi:hypothetical protein